MAGSAEEESKGASTRTFDEGVAWPSTIDADYRAFLERGLLRSFSTLESAESEGDARRVKRARRAYGEELRRVQRRVSGWSEALQCAPLIAAIRAVAAELPAAVEKEEEEPQCDEKCVICLEGLVVGCARVLLGCCGVEVHASCACTWYKSSERTCVHCRAKLNGSTNVSIDATYVAAWNAALVRRRLPPSCVPLDGEAYHRRSPCRPSGRSQGPPRVVCDDDGVCRSCADISIDGDAIHRFVEAQLQGRWPEHGAFARVVRMDGVWQDLRFERFVNAYWAAPYVHMTHGCEEVDETYDIPLAEIKSFRVRKALAVSQIYMACGSWIKDAEGKRGIAVLPRESYEMTYEGLVDDPVGPKIALRRRSSGSRVQEYLSLVDRLHFPTWVEPSAETRNLTITKTLVEREEYTIRSSRGEVTGRGVFLGVSRSGTYMGAPTQDLLHFIVAGRYTPLRLSDVGRLER
jgi:hypothetical protein